MNTPQLYDIYKTKMQRIADVRNASALMQWDQETYLPPKGAAFRGQQISTLSELSHKLFIEEELGSLLNDLANKDDLDQFQKRNVERTLEDYKKNKKYTSQFVRALSDQVNKAFHAWIEARKQNKFSIFQPELDKLIALKKEETQLLGFEKHPYDALLDEFEKGCTVELLDRTFTGIIPVLKELLQKIAARPQVDDSFLQQAYPKQKQWEWGMHLVRQLNFDFEAGRQDISEHPFSTSFNSRDVRITTRIDENDFANMTWSCIHETGHALYEQGLLSDYYGLPLGEACSYSIHESQSRLWENNIGRSLIFWQHYFPELRQYFPEQFKNITLDQFYKGINKVQPSFIRTEADEITYHFHVYIRYELEKKLIEGSLSASDIPDYWNGQYKQLMDITVPDDKKGCLQDVHWSHGSFGYFPTYSLGSFYAAQFFQQAEKEIPSLQSDLKEGNSLALLQWLREKIHSKGRFHTSEELCKSITGTGLEINSFTSYLLDKYSSIYTL
jgi:carboxypeptidase Taq